MKRLRPVYSELELAGIYKTPHDHTKWPDHKYRVEKTIIYSNLWLTDDDVIGADLSCGDGAILNGLDVPNRIFGDFAPGYAYQGPIEETIKQIPPVDVFVCCETLEHIDDPLTLLEDIRAHTNKLILSTPEAEDDDNPEHYWCWNRSDIWLLLRKAGFDPIRFHEIKYAPMKTSSYTYQLWFAE